MIFKMAIMSLSLASRNAAYLARSVALVLFIQVAALDGGMTLLISGECLTSSRVLNGELGLRAIHCAILASADPGWAARVAIRLFRSCIVIGSTSEAPAAFSS